MKSAAAKVRAVAAQTVDAVVRGGQSLDGAIQKNQVRVDAQDASLLRMLCYGCLRNHWQLQAWVGQLLGKPLRRRDSVVNALLSVGIYQLVQMRIPDHAVVSESVSAARILRRPKLAGLVNACLRRFVREGFAEHMADDEQSRWNHPRWMIDTIQRDWPDDWQSVLAANNQRAPMWLRVNSRNNAAVPYRRHLLEAGMDSDLIAGIPDAVRLHKPQAVEDLPGFALGDASVQDAAAQIAARWLLRGCEPGNTVLRMLDACAAPGGKSGHLLELGGDGLTLLAVDNDESRLAGIRQNLHRIGREAKIIAADASMPEQWWDGVLFDRILLDAPCSASGVIRRHPDIKLLRRASDIEPLVQVQRAMLDALWPLLVPGGVLLYVTCSIFSKENDAVTERFLSQHSDAVENAVLPNNNIRDLMRRKACGYQILPGLADLDGFYYAALQKKKAS